MLIVAGVWFMRRNIAVTITPSLLYTVFYLENGPVERIQRGDYVLFHLENPITQELGFDKAIKEAACVGGQTLVVDRKRYYCDGTYLGTAKEYSLKGERVENFKVSGVIPEGSYFVIGHHKDSFDSRYFGFVRKQEVERIAHPLF